MTEERPYHHGELKEALITEAVAVIARDGADGLSLRDLAKRLGVSPAAPFRHFPTKAALLTAVAEQSMARLVESVRLAMEDRANHTAMTGIRTMAQGYVRWALENPTHFLVVSSRSLIDFAGSDLLVTQNETLRQNLETLFRQAQAEGSIAAGWALEDLMLLARGTAYGLARMATDGHLPEWKVERPAPIAIEAAISLFIDLLSGARPPSQDSAI